jgi:hypothetical protein
MPTSEEFLMSDYERYGDYNDIEEDEPRQRGPVLIILKILVAVVCVGVVGLIAFRLVLFNNYPDAAKELYFDSELTAIAESEGAVKVKTQSLRAPYDDPDVASFFCDYLYVIDDTNQLQITVRYNTATVRNMAAELGKELSPDDQTLFTYRLVDNYGRVYSDYKIASFDEQMMYRYVKLVFNSVDTAPMTDAPEWIRIEIYLEGRVDESGNPKPYMIPVYENNENYSKFEELMISPD